MKKISVLMALTVLLSMAFTSCKEDTQPRLERPTEFVLNTPALADNTYVLSANDGVELSVSQADYGMGIVPTYTVEVATKADKSDAKALPEQYTNARFTVPGESLSLALCEQLGYVSEETFSNKAVPVYVRVISSVAGCDYATIASNWIELKSVQPYFAVKLPDNIWVIGQPTGWDVASSDMVLTETEIESRIYQGTYYIAAGEFQFRFYDQLGDWSSWSIGAQDEDNPVDISFTDGVYEGPAYLGGAGDEKGKGSWQVADWAGGTVKMTVNLSNPKKASVIFEIVD
ncbi:MAG: SusE domain-containing protein [Prevotella sp.]|nr:SusE domain-containing protein [Prevotella sp.]MCM1075072.1 SusE domain-containing protein [Ruminococcus sp.]